MTEMLERCARAAYRASEELGESPLNDTHVAFWFGEGEGDPKYNPAIRDEAMRVARAVLTALLEPDEAMVEAGAHQAHSTLIGYPPKREEWMVTEQDYQELADGSHNDPWPETNFHLNAKAFRKVAGPAFQAMIRAAMGEG